MTTLKLHNKGERNFDLEGGRLAPDQVGEFPKDYAEKLMEIYPNELVDLEAKTKAFSGDVTKFDAPSSAEVSTPEMTVEINGEMVPVSEVAKRLANAEAGKAKAEQALKEASKPKESAADKKAREAKEKADAEAAAKAKQ